MLITKYTKKTVNPLTRETEFRVCDKCGKEHTEVVYMSSGTYGVSCAFKLIVNRSPKDVHEARNLVHNILKHANGSVNLFKQSIRFEAYGERVKEIELTVNPDLTLEDLLKMNN